jgi:hypothetical protein
MRLPLVLQPHAKRRLGGRKGPAHVLQLGRVWASSASVALSQGLSDIRAVVVESTDEPTNAHFTVPHLHTWDFPRWHCGLGSAPRAVLPGTPQEAVPEGASAELGDDVFWFASAPKERYRWDLLVAFPLLREFLRSGVWPEKINFGFTAYVYPVFVALLFLGPQDRAHNFALNIFWDYWWPGIFVVRVGAASNGACQGAASGASK